MRQIIHAHRDGKYVAIDNPGAVVVDHDAKMIRAGLKRWPVPQKQHWRFLAHLLSNANQVIPREEISDVLGRPIAIVPTMSVYVRLSEPIMIELGMVFETIFGTASYRLHTDPRETIECCRNLAPGQPLPWRLQSTPAGRGKPRTTCGKSPARPTTYLGRSSATPSR